MKTLAIVVLLGLNVTFLQVAYGSQEYCAAIRGNGENGAAHWSGVSHLVEENGLPRAMAGGSSAAITMFLVESVAQNPVVQDILNSKGLSVQSKAARLYYSLLIKSFHGYLEFIASQSEIQELEAFVESDEIVKIVAEIKKAFMDRRGGGHLVNVDLLEIDIAAAHSIVIRLIPLTDKLVAKYGELVNPKFMYMFNQAKGKIFQLVYGHGVDREQHISAVRFLMNEIYQVVVNFGKFNAWSDKGVFFRPGLISFEVLADRIGRAGNFYAGTRFDEEDKRNLSSFLEECGAVSSGESWQTLNSDDSSHCRSLFFNALRVYRRKQDSNDWRFKEDENRLQQMPGVTIPVVANTSIVYGRAAKEYLEIQRAYFDNPSVEVGKAIEKFEVDFDRELGFGYWGEVANERQYLSRLPDDLKSQKFRSLTPTQWRDILSLSPAEPGLASMQLISSAEGEHIYSAGGWSDLHPVQVLRALSVCENVVYVTRKNGESLFAQGVLYSLTNVTGVPVGDLTVPDKDVRTANNNKGTPGDFDSDWSRLYNTANPDSSFNRALVAADAVLCTDWDNYDVKAAGELAEMADQAYGAPLYVSPDSNFSANGFNTISHADNTLLEAGYFKYTGCIPQSH